MPVSNVLLITVDSLRADSLCTDDDTSITPRIAEFASDATSFSQAISNGPNTPSSFPSILTGTHPLIYGGYRYLDEQRPFLSESLRSNGFATVGYHSNPHLGPEKNYNHGFDNFNDGAEDDDSSTTIKNLVDRNIDSNSRLYAMLRRIYHYFEMTTDSSAYTPAPQINERAVDWLDGSRTGGDPFFMWLHYMDVHYPFTPPDSSVEALGETPLSKRRIADLNGKMQEDPNELTDQDVRDLRTLYEAEIRYTDHHIGQLFDELVRRNVLDETAVFITADHGEAFGEHGRFGHHPYHFDELVHVPLIARIPGNDHRTVKEQVSLIDLPPTICDIFGIDAPDTFQGRSLTPLIEGGSLSDEPAICTSKGGDVLACRTPRWKCIWRVEDKRVRLFNLVTDPGEVTDVAGDNPEVVKALLEPLQNYREEADATDVSLPEVEESEAAQDRLRELGYLD